MPVLLCLRYYFEIPKHQVRPLERQLLLVILIIILIFGFYVPETRKIKRMITIKIMNFVMPQADLPQAENSYTVKLIGRILNAECGT